MPRTHSCFGSMSPTVWKAANCGLVAAAIEEIHGRIVIMRKDGKRDQPGAFGPLQIVSWTNKLSMSTILSSYASGSQIQPGLHIQPGLTGRQTCSTRPLPWRSAPSSRHLRQGYVLISRMCGVGRLFTIFVYEPVYATMRWHT